ncbi:MAG TPA: hypothetical protein VGH85_20060 [Mycobacteriales bacterium]
MHIDHSVAVITGGASVSARVLTVCPGNMDIGMLAGVDEKRRATLMDLHVSPKRLGMPEDFARLVSSFMENTLLNGDVVRLDAATRL